MKLRIPLAETLLVAGVLQILLVRDAQAYLDPGAASFFFQMVVASILGALLTLKVYWRKVKATVRGLFSSKKEEPAAPVASEPADPGGRSSA